MRIMRFLRMVVSFFVLPMWLVQSSDPEPATFSIFPQLHTLSNGIRSNPHAVHAKNIQQQQQFVMNNVIQLVKQQDPRLLQDQECNTTAGSENECVLQTPEAACALYKNKTAGLLSCACSRFGTKDTQIDCTYNQPQCNSDKTMCYIGSISQILNVALKSRVITTCTTYLESFVTTVPLNAELCIRVFPFQDGYYESLSSCVVTLNLESGNYSTGSEGKLCHSKNF